MTGGEAPNLYPKYTSQPIEAEPLQNQPKHSKESAITFRELLFRRKTPTASDSAAPKTCDKAALVFLVDASTSMTEEGSDGNTKLTNLKTALSQFVTTLPDEAIFGLYTFSSPNGGEPRERVRIASISEVKGDISAAIAGINPPTNAATHMRAGFEKIQDALSSAKEANSGYTFNLIFISDGVPENENECIDQYTLTGQCDRSGANNSRNYDKRHDPTGRWGDEDIPQAIKDSGVRIYSIVISNATDAQVFPELKDLMQRISSDSQYYKESIGGGNLDTTYQQIKSSACS